MDLFVSMGLWRTFVGCKRGVTPRGSDPVEEKTLLGTQADIRKELHSSKTSRLQEKITLAGEDPASAQSSAAC